MAKISSSSKEPDSETEYPQANVMVIKPKTDTLPPAKIEMSAENWTSLQPPRTLYGIRLEV